MLEIRSAETDSLSRNVFYTLNSFCLNTRPFSITLLFLIPYYYFALLQSNVHLSTFPVDFKVHLNLYVWTLLLKHAGSGRHDLRCKHKFTSL